jgi:hypothetical protein
VVADTGYMASVDTYEIVVKGRLSPVLIEAIGAASANCVEGLTHLVVQDSDQPRLYSLFSLLRDLNITLISMNAMEIAAPRG